MEQRLAHQRLLVLPKSQQQLSYVLLKQSQHQQQQQQQQPLILLQQGKGNDNKSADQQVLMLQQLQGNDGGVILQDPGQPSNRQQHRQENREKPIGQGGGGGGPLRVLVPLLPVQPVKKLSQDCNAVENDRSRAPKKWQRSPSVVTGVEKNKEEEGPVIIVASKPESGAADALINQEFMSTEIGLSSVGELDFIEELPSTSDEIFPDAYNSKASDIEDREAGNLSDSGLRAADGDGDGPPEEMKDIYTRIDYGGYQCNICQLTRLDRRSMLFHISGQHSHLRPFKCPSCGKTFKRKYSLKTHQLSHSLAGRNVETFGCDKCNYRTPNSVSLRYHYYRVHTNEFRFTCEHCGRRFKVKRELADHLVTHSGVQHMCDICGKLYRGEHLLRAHRRLHLDLYKYQCPICKKKLATEVGLTNHTKLHNRIYECDECGMKFPSKFNLIKHRNVHTREQAFPCPACGKVFADQPTQKVHSLIHAGLKPYRCNVCGLGFTQRTPMMLHWRKKHPGETEPPPPVILKNILKDIEERNGKKPDDRT